MEEEKSLLKKKHLRHLQETGLIKFDQKDANIKKKCCIFKTLYVPYVAPFPDYDEVIKQKINKFIILNNPTSRGGAGDQNYLNFLKMMQQNNVQFEVVTSQSLEFFQEFVSNFDFSNNNVLVIGGGDGTAYHAVATLYKRPIKSGEKFTVAFIPKGTGNGLALSLGYSINQWPKLLEAFQQGNARKLEITKCRYKDGNGNVIEDTFTTLLGMGAMARIICHGDQVTKLLSKPARFVWAGIYECFVAHKIEICSIEVDGKLVLENIKMQMMHILPGQNNNDNLIPRYVPYAQVNDGIVDMIIFSDIKINFMVNLINLKAFTGAHIYHKNVQYVRGKKIKIYFQKPTLITVDGEKFPIIHEYLEIFCDSSRLRVIC